MKTRRRKVYIASRMTNGDGQSYAILAIRDAIILAAKLQELGYAPYCPQLTVFSESIHPLPYESWLGLDFEWIDVCDVVLRLDNVSKGADREVDYAQKRGIPVFFGTLFARMDIDEFLAEYPPTVEILDEATVPNPVV